MKCVRSSADLDLSKNEYTNKYQNRRIHSKAMRTHKEKKRHGSKCITSFVGTWLVMLKQKFGEMKLCIVVYNLHNVIHACIYKHTFKYTHICKIVVKFCHTYKLIAKFCAKINRHKVFESIIGQFGQIHCVRYIK